MNKPHVLVVDDEPELRETIADWLFSEGFHVATARDGERAVDIALRRRFDCVVMDLRLPGISGKEAIQKLHQANPELRFILITGQPAQDHNLEEVGTYLSAWMQKPLDFRELSEAIRKALQSGSGATH